MEGNLRFKIDWASLIVGRKLTVFALFYFVFEGSFPSTSPLGAYIWTGDFTEGFLRYEFWGLIFGGDLFSEFYGLTSKSSFCHFRFFLFITIIIIIIIIIIICNSWLACLIPYRWTMDTGYQRVHLIDRLLF